MTTPSGALGQTHALRYSQALRAGAAWWPGLQPPERAALLNKLRDVDPAGHTDAVLLEAADLARQGVQAEWVRAWLDTQGQP